MQAPESMQETFMSDSEDEGGEFITVYLEFLFSFKFLVIKKNVYLYILICI